MINNHAVHLMKVNLVESSFLLYVLLLHLYRIHGQDPWIQIGSGPDDRYLGQSAPQICNQKPICLYICKVARSACTYARHQAEAVCALVDSVTSSYSIARVDCGQSRRRSRRLTRVMEERDADDVGGVEPPCWEDCTG